MSARRVVSPSNSPSTKSSTSHWALAAGLVAASGVGLNLSGGKDFDNSEGEMNDSMGDIMSEISSSKVVDEALQASGSRQGMPKTELSANQDAAAESTGNTAPELGLEMPDEMREIEQRNKKFTERFDRLVSENFENRFTERENAVLQRRRHNYADVLASVKAAESEVLQIRHRHKLVTPEQILEAQKEPATLLLRVTEKGTGGTSLQPLRFTPEKYKLIKDFVYSIEDGSIEEFSRVDPSAKSLLALKHDPLREQEYILGVFYTLARRSPAFHHWIFEELDENHPLYSLDGTLDQSKLPSDRWTICELKGGGQVPIQKEDVPLFPTLADRWFFTKVSKATPLDRRFMAKEFDMQGDSSRVGMIIKIVQNAIERYWQMVRPADKDRAYYFDLEEDVPYDGTKAQLKMDNSKYGNYHLSREMAQLLFVPAGDKPLRCDKRQVCINLALTIKHLKSFASTGGEIKQDDLEDPDSK